MSERSWALMDGVYRPTTLFSAQFANGYKLDAMAEAAKRWGYDGLELACGASDHFDVYEASGPNATAYCKWVHDTLAKHDLRVYAISNHCTGQCVLDRIDERHRGIVSPRVWGDGMVDGVCQRATEEMRLTAVAARNLGVKVANGFTGSSIWHLLYGFPPGLPSQIEDGFKLFKDRWTPILDAFAENGVKFALEVHPTEIAFDLKTAKRALEAVKHHPAFGFNYDPSHLGYQGVDYVRFIYELGDRIWHSHWKDVYWAPMLKRAGVFGGHTNFGDPDRFWDFRSLGRGCIDFEEIVRALNYVGYFGPNSVEWEDSGMNREHGAREARDFVVKKCFPPSEVAFDAAFEKK